VLVSIWLDPANEETKGPHLKAFEKGDFGPIFATDPDELEVAQAQEEEYSLYSTGFNENPGMVPRSQQEAQAAPGYGGTIYAPRYPADAPDLYGADDNNEGSGQPRE
jgi:hypothetical protein